MQTRFGSVVERIVDLAIGMVISVLLFEYIILPFYGIEKSSQFQSFEIVVFFTFVSFIRGYFVRRLFNAITVSSLKKEF